MGEWQGLFMDCLLSLYRKASTPPLLCHTQVHARAHAHTYTHMQSHTRYMGIYSAAGHTVGFPNCWTVMPSLSIWIVRVCVWLNELWGVRKGCWSGSVWLLAECFSTSHYSYLPNDCWPEQIWSPTGSHQRTGPAIQINAARGTRCQIRAPSSKNFLILWRGGSKSDPGSVSVPAQGRQGFLKFMVAARESTGLLIASRKRVGRNPLMIHTIIFLSGKYCGWGGERLSSSLLSSLFHCLFHTAKTCAPFADLMLCFSFYLPSYLPVRAFYKKGEQSALFEVKWLGKEQIESMFSTCLALSSLISSW